MDEPPVHLPRGHLVVAGVSGLAVTVLEFAAVRFMAPSFGQSNYIWANVIGVILLALALGYWIGGRLADRSRTARPLYLAYALAALYITAIAYLGAPLCQWLLPEGIESARILPLAFTGSLIATVLLFGPPTFVLGMTSPFLVRLDDAPGRAGRVAGRIFAVGTVGSLVGCYVGPLWWLQSLGSRGTILLSASMLAALAAGGFLLDRRVRSVVGVGLVALVLGLSGATVHASVVRPPLRTQEGQLTEIESTYQTIRVVEREAEVLGPSEYPLYGDATSVRTRFLRHDEDTDTYQSVCVWPPEDGGRFLVGGRYYEHLALGAFFHRPERPDTLRVLILGYAGGAVQRALRLTLPEDVRLEVLGVEIDPAVVEASRRWLDLGSLEGEGTRIVTGEDARTVVNALRDDERFDLVLVDAYARTSYVPFQLVTRELFAHLRRHLAEGGWIGVNVHSRRGMAGRLLRAIATTMDRAVGPTYAVPNPLYPGSVVLWAAPAASTPPRLSASFAFPRALDTAALALERLGTRHVPQAEDVLLTDDLAPVDRLADEEFLRR